MKNPIEHPIGTTRISDSVVGAVAATAAREATGVLDITPLARGAVFGGTVGSLVGLLAGGAGGAVIGAVVGASTGSVAGAALSEIDSRHMLLDMDEEIPVVELQISAQYGSDLQVVSEEIRLLVREAFDSILGVSVGRVDIVVVEVVDPPTIGPNNKLP